MHKIKLRNYLQYTNPSVECALDGQDLFTFSVLAAIKELPHAKQMVGKRVDGIVGIMERSVIRPTRGKSFETNARKLKAYSDNSIASVDEDSIICTVLIPETIEDIISLTRKIDKLSRKIVDLYKDNLLYKTIYEYDEIGKSSAAQIACEIGRIEDYKKINQLIASTGLDPRIDESGTSVNIKRKISKKGNKYLRTLLFQTVESILMIEARNGTSQLPDSMSTYYEKKHSDENKHHYAALVACSTKLITRIFYRYKDNYAKQLEQQKE